MNKIIVIETCYNCPYSRLYNSQDGDYFCKITSDFIEDAAKIADFCPLDNEDYSSEDKDNTSVN